MVIMINKGMFSNNDNEWETPQELFDSLNNQFHFKLDAAASDANHKCMPYLTKEMDSLTCDWLVDSGGGAVWLNPPYKGVIKWVDKIVEEQAKGTVIVALLPSRTDTKWFHKVIEHASGVLFIKGRLKFSGKGSAPFPSVIMVFGLQGANVLLERAEIEGWLC